MSFCFWSIPTINSSWAFLVTEKLLYATSKKLTGRYVMPDANYFFEEIDLQ